MTTPWGRVSDRELRAFDDRARDLVHAYHAAGWQTRMSARGHVIARAPDGVTTEAISRNSSNRRRTGANAQADLRRWIRTITPDKEHDMSTSIDVSTDTSTTTTTTYDCPDCDRTCASASGLRLHRQTHIGITCPTCGLVFSHSRLYGKHQRTVHGIEPKKRRNVDAGDDGLFHCPVCDRTWDTHRKLSGHLRAHPAGTPAPATEPAPAPAPDVVTTDHGRLDEWLAGHDPVDLLTQILAVAAPPLVADLERLRKERDDALAEITRLRGELVEKAARLDLIKEAMGA